MFAPTSTSKSGRRLTRAVSRIVSSPTLTISITLVSHNNMLLHHLVEVVGELQVVVDEVAQGGLLGSRQLLFERERERDKNVPI